jgi:two-component system chemotaxis sensor kinase CheA
LRRVRSTIQLKLSAVIVGLVIVVVALLAGVFTASHVRDLEQNLRKQAATYGQLLVRDVSSAVAFNDRQTAREVFEAVSVDRAVTGIALYGAGGRLLEVRGDLDAPAALMPPQALEINRTARSIRVLAPVVSLEGPRGALLLELSGESVAAGKRRAIGMALAWGLGAALLGLLAAWFIARALARRLFNLARAATAVAGGDLEQRPVVDHSTDEIGRLAAAFNSMWSKLKALLDQIQRSAREEAERLDGLVQARTAELDRRNTEMRLVLDHVEQGLVTIDGKGRVGAERSRILDSWFGTPAPNALLWDWLPLASDNRRDWFLVAWQALEDDLVPLELAIDQLPAGLEVGARSFRFAYKPLMRGPALSGILLVITDETARRERERAERDRQELGEVVERFHRDRTGVLEFFEEARSLVNEALSVQDRALLLRALHTLKGGSAMMGLGRLAEVCHELETGIVEGEPLGSAGQQRLRAQWDDVESRFARILGAGNNGRLDVDEHDHDALMNALDRGASPVELRRLARRMRLEPVEQPLLRLAEQAKRLADRLGKGPLDVAVDGGDLRLPPRALGEFWSACVHVLRNAIDHGIAAPTPDQPTGRHARARLELRARIDGDWFEIEIRDFGRGIDWVKIKRRAQASGRACDTPEALTDALFTDGISTKDETTEISGRGFGMGAARQACERAGGSILLSSRPGEGTSVRFRFPHATLGVIAGGEAGGDVTPATLAQSTRVAS